MLSYALLIALLYAGDNKKLKTLLAIATALAMLKGNSTKKVRRPRSKRARRILAERALAKKEKKDQMLDKVQVFLPVIIKAIELLTANASNNTSGHGDNKATKQTTSNNTKRADVEANEGGSFTDIQIDDITIKEDEYKQRQVEQLLYNPEDRLIKEEAKNLAEVIKENFHGTTVNLTLKSGERLNGEVIGEYKGFLILESKGILKYVDGNNIDSFS